MIELDRDRRKSSITEPHGRRENVIGREGMENGVVCSAVGSRE